MESLITSEIIINGTVVFIPARRELKNSVTGESFILHTPANYCLLHLLARRPHILTKAELIKLSWDVGTQIISDNTFYQMIFNLRQGLAKAGGEGIIVTIPRRGLQINPDISVKIMNTGVVEKSEEKTETVHSVFNFHSFIMFFVALCLKRPILLIILSVGGGGMSVLLYTTGYDKYAFSNYQYDKIQMCMISYSDTIQKENIRELLSKSRVDCSKKTHVYLTESENHSRLSAISCLYDTVKIKRCSLSLYIQ